jgi:hypothetical protein
LINRFHSSNARLFVDDSQGGRRISAYIKNKKVRKPKVLRLKAKIDINTRMNHRSVDHENHPNQKSSQGNTILSRSFDKSPINLNANSFDPTL